MNKFLVWDIPARVFHWAFAACLTGAVAIGFIADEDSPFFQTHMLLGIIAVFLLVARIIMGVVGSRYARFSSFPLHPMEQSAYFASAVFSKTKRYAGNNPGSALAAVLMFLLVPALFVTGTGLAGHQGGELHEGLAWAFVVVIGLHLAGLALHSIRHRENIAMAMITGRKSGEPTDAIPSSHPAWGAAFVLAALLYTGSLFANHNAGGASVTLPLTGITLNLGDNEGGKRGSQNDRHLRQDDDDD